MASKRRRAKSERTNQSRATATRQMVTSKRRVETVEPPYMESEDGRLEMEAWNMPAENRRNTKVKRATLKRIERDGEH
jgi:hypothetical protein